MATEILTIVKILTTEIDAASISSALKLEPTNSWLTGDPVKGQIRTRKQNGWQLVRKERSRDISALTEQAVTLLYSRSEALRALRKSAAIEVVLQAIAYCDEGQGPSLLLDASIFKKLADLELVFECQTYCLNKLKQIETSED